MPARIKAEDEVIVIGGKDRGKRGKVLRVDPKKGRLYVEGLNMIKRHQKPQQVGTRGGQVGGVIDKEGPIHISSVMLICPGCDKNTRVGHTKLSDGTRVRVCRRCDTTFEN